MTVVAQAILLAAALALTLAGVAAALTGANVWKRVTGVAIALIGAAIACATLGAGAGAVIACAALALAYTLFGAALGVRIHEAYGASEIQAVDRADLADEPPEPSG